MKVLFALAILGLALPAAYGLKCYGASVYGLFQGKKPFVKRGINLDVKFRKSWTLAKTDLKYVLKRNAFTVG